MAETAAAADVDLLDEADDVPHEGPATCLCQGMAQWCRRGLHKHCACPHEGGRRGAAAILTRGENGLYVIDAGTRSWLTLHLMEKPCRLHEVCPCDCHQARKATAVRLVQEALFDPAKELL